MRLVAVWRPSADRDLEEILAFIAKNSHGRFWSVLEEVVDRIHDFQEANQVLYEEKAVRRVRLKPFPYFLFYKIEGERIAILALMGSRQDPERWKERF